MRISSSLARFARDDSGATAIEYGLLAGLISVVIIYVVYEVGQELLTVFETIRDRLQAPAGPAA